jgi:alkylation response protein AidB-like acyl-CoA dehydrogenase
MDFDLTPEQEQLHDSVLRFGREHCDFAAWRRIVADQSPFDPANWRRMADLGWLAIGVPEEYGGLGGSAVDIMVLMEGAGRCLGLEPLTGTAVIAPALLQHAAPSLRETLLAGIVSGDTLVALAEGEPEGGFDLAWIATAAKQEGDGFVLTGVKSQVSDGASAGWFIVPARTSGEVDDPAGITLFLVPADAPGLSQTGIRAPDHRHHARLALDRVSVGADTVIGSVGDGLGLLEYAVDCAITARLAEAVGAMDVLRDMTLDYLKTRRQFDVVIGSFQALQHRMVDIALACEEARSMMYQATMRLGAPRGQRRRAVSAAKALVGQAGLFVGHQAVQLHGGIGASDELAVSHYLKRLLMIDLAFGNADHHRRLFAAEPV